MSKRYGFISVDQDDYSNGTLQRSKIYETAPLFLGRRELLFFAGAYHYCNCWQLIIGAG
ncbi:MULTISPECIES: hypothetical protein [unclassified Paenibacillus]|uniref:hypothetical protein n=1 Tax=unclassified Paenibacillus TaxID=185978 RepID=UPI002406395E|nr:MULTISPECIES: hypothetical protein [unclassified Paenibacillus]MDF9844381.1 hypothetical protein [Paenibacillus sp. PastF-2]MDF9850985.1 hypothetical protein [Paenibacillus sp. PastM-2]MDF9857556.1 hypothetical protein [Paenibacillus sp. PastF-1]MDH6482803.1 hypothetical protein [Paenibacillus sp. PastH-2]